MPKGEHTNSRKPKLKKLTLFKSFLEKFLHFLVLSLLLMIGSLLVATFVYYRTYTNKIYPGISIGNIDLGDKTILEATQLLASYFPPPTFHLTLVTGGQVWEMPISEINLSFEATATARKAFRFGRTGRLGLDLSSKRQAIISGVRLPPVYQYDKSMLDKKVLELSALVDVETLPSTLTITDQEVAITPSRAGQVLDKSQLLANLRSRFENFLLSDPIVLPTITLKPTFNEDRARKARQILEKLITNPLILTWQEKSWTIDASQALNFFPPIGTVSAQPGSTYLLGEEGQVFANPLSPVFPRQKESLVNDDILRNYLENLALEIDREPQDAVFQFTSGKVSVFKPSRQGQKLDIDKTTSLISKTLIEEKEPVDNNFQITLPVEVINPKVTTGEVNNLGIRELLGRGVSNFQGSPESRVHNIALSTERLNGILIAPGEIFSFNEKLGEVSAATGYKQAYVIKQDRTILDDGGGVCQVSTTLFRAVLRTGLPIIERTAHAYRVVYYERASSVGFDATVYPPSVDLKFQNDTPAYILIQSGIDQKTNEVTFEFYGTSDGRRVELGAPVITSQVPPPEPLHREDPNLPKGEVRQIERPVWGANVTFSYKVTRDGEILRDEVIHSRYRPWGAVYLVGTKE